MFYTDWRTTLHVFAGVTMTLWLYARSRFRLSSLLDLVVMAPCGNSVPCQIWPVVRRHGRGVLWAGGDPCMTGCLECVLGRPVLSQSWSQTATDRAWYSTTAFLSGRDRPRRLCVIRLSGSKLGVQERSDLPPEQQPPRGARRKCGARPLSTTNVAGCINTLKCPTSIEHSASTYVVHGQRSVGGSPAQQELVRVGGPLADWTGP